MNFCDDFNDKSIMYYIQNDKYMPSSIYGRRLDSHCTDPIGIKKIQNSSEIYFNSKDDNFSRYNGSRMNVLPTLYTPEIYNRQKYLQFISGLD